MSSVRSRAMATRWTYDAMKQRCSNPNDSDYPNYGGRGITYDPSWETYAGFLADMGKRPEGMTLDRVDVNGNYCKENCRWATPKEQRANSRPYSKPRINSTTKCLGVAFSSTSGRYTVRAGWGDARVLLYSGKDLFEACCRRKSWESQNVGCN